MSRAQTRPAPNACERILVVVGQSGVVLCDGCKHEFVLRAVWAAQPEATKPQDTLEVGEQRDYGPTEYPASLYQHSLQQI
jgi:hypothetical protein